MAEGMGGKGPGGRNLVVSQDGYFIMQSLFAPSEPAVQRGVEKHCQVCNAKFSVITREHQCKRCLKAVCSDCGKHHLDIFNPTAPAQESHRACRSCKEASDYIASLVHNQRLVFGKMSTIGQEWMKKIEQKEIKSRTNSNKNHLFTKDTFEQIWRSYSFELRELVGRLTYQYEQDSLYSMVYGVFTAVIGSSPPISLSKVIYLIMFLLCFCSPESATLLAIYLVNLRHEVKDLKAVALRFAKAMPYEGQYNKIEDYAQYRFDRFADSYWVNCSSVECSVSVLGEVLRKRGLQEMLMFFAAHLFVNRGMLVIKAANSPRSLVDQLMLRNCLFVDINVHFKYLKNKDLMPIIDPNANSPVQSPIKSP
jgi:hypothetical protein